MKKQLLSVLIALAFAACGGAGEEETAPRPAAEPAPAPVEPGTAATISGKVVLEGEAPGQQDIQMGADPVCARMHSTPVRTEFVVANEDGSLQNVFVYVKEGLGERKFSPPSEAVVLDQRGCTYTPHVFGVMTGQEIEILNSDDTLHNIHAMPEKNRQFNIGQPVKGLKTKRKFEVPEVMVPFKCDVHKWMNAYAGVLDHPYFAVTREAGSFEIPNLPPGDYVVEAWHEKFGTQTQNVTVGEKETKEITFTFAATE
ncbi:MAG: carboxypeptidase regulatory-like domain-containing protein [Acidobacteriota bacterium]